MLLALLLAAAPRTFDWPAMVNELPALKSYAPVKAPDAAFAKIGGKCWRVNGKLNLGEGTRNGHAWHWSASVRVEGATVTFDPPGAEHGFDRPGDTRTFKRETKPVTYVAGPSPDNMVPLYAKSFELEIACWGTDESSMMCDGQKKICKRCSVIRLMGSPHASQRVYGDGVIRADFTKDCAHACDGPGLKWEDFEALAAAAKRLKVIDLEAEKVGMLYRTTEACVAGTFDFAPDFVAGEPPVPK